MFKDADYRVPQEAGNTYPILVLSGFYGSVYRTPNELVSTGAKRRGLEGHSETKRVLQLRLRKSGSARSLAAADDILYAHPTAEI